MELASIFSDNMILQRDKDVRVFGYSSASEEIEITIDNIRVSEKVEGGWCILLPPHEAGGPFDLYIKSPKETKVFTGVLYGEVWLNNGQSNIELELQDSAEAHLELMQSYPDVRYFNVSKAATISEAEELRGSECWKKCIDGSFGDISAIGYYYAVRLREKLGVPVGIIDCYLGGTSISCWLEKERLVSSAEGQYLYNKYLNEIEGQSFEVYQERLKLFEESCDKYVRDIEKLREENPEITPAEISEKLGGGPWPPPLSEDSAFRPCGLVETMLKSISPYTIRGEVFYQGEEDAANNLKYVETFGDLNKPETNKMYKNLLLEKIRQDRALFMDDTLPFFIIQLPRYIEVGDEDLCDWAYIREAQEEVSKLVDRAYLINILDLGELGNIHPTDKKTPGIRTANRILETVFSIEYPQDLIYKDCRKEGSLIYITFENIYDGLLSLTDKINGFEVSDDGKNFIKPELYIDGDSVVIENAESIRYIRYGFFNYGEVGLRNSKGMELRQFRIRL